jgi:hypothetical protein
MQKRFFLGKLFLKRNELLLKKRLKVKRVMDQEVQLEILKNLKLIRLSNQ